jgi:hypothetical protein
MTGKDRPRAATGCILRNGEDHQERVTAMPSAGVGHVHGPEPQVHACTGQQVQDEFRLVLQDLDHSFMAEFGHDHSMAASYDIPAIHPKWQTVVCRALLVMKM